MTKAMSLGPIMCDLSGRELLADEAEMLMHPYVGGVILFTRNYESPEQITALTRQIRCLRQPPLLIAVDHEGGRIQRFREGFSPLPASARFARYRQAEAVHLAEQAGWLMAAELLAIGVDISFAPVLDVGGKDSRVIGDRAFHSDPQQVARLAGACIRGMKQAGMVAVGKHFPGHGSVSEDSHHVLPCDGRLLADIKIRDLIPFESMIHAGLSGLMTAHVVYPEVDQKPASFSAIWLQEILRKQMGFQGAVFSDDLSMAGAGVMGDYVGRTRAALAAGCDMVLTCNDRQGVIDLLDSAEICNTAESASRLVPMYGRYDMSFEQLKQTALWRERSEVISCVERETGLEDAG